MYLHAIRHAVPPTRLSQAECWEALRKSKTLADLKPRSQALLEKVLLSDSGIQTRHFACDDVRLLFDLDAEALNHRFEKEAVRLGNAALKQALESAEIDAKELDALFVCTCTGYLCPGLSSHIAEAFELGQHTYLQDIVGLGCGAAIPMLRSAHGFSLAHPEAKIACIAVEVCSAAFYLDDDPGVLISATLFGDAASASIWSGEPASGRYQVDAFDTLHLPEEREALRFINSRGKLKNKLARTVPQTAAKAVKQLYDRSGISADIPVVAHVGGRDVLLAIEDSLQRPPIQSSWDTLSRLGNTSSPSVLIATETAMAQKPEQATFWLTSFGAGFAAHACQLSLE